MKKYIALYIAPIASLDKMMKDSNPEQMQKGMDMWKSWMESNKSAITDMGAPLGKTKTVNKSGITDTSNGVCGYTIVEADSPEAAAKVFESSPHLMAMEGATIDVIECMDMSDKK